MVLVDYASSSEEETTNPLHSKTCPTLKRKRSSEITPTLPPLPSKFLSLYASTTRPSTRDDPALHDGRKRVIPHIEGNWPTHLYIEWYPSPTECDSLTNLISTLQTTASLSGDIKIHSSLASDLDVPLPLHISLSRSLGFSAESKGEFIDALTRAIQNSGIRPFEIQFTGLDWVSNFENTRWFLVLRMQRPVRDGLNRLLNNCNTVVEERGQPPLYATPRPPTNKIAKHTSSKRKPSNSDEQSDIVQDLSSAFHFSIAWMLEKPDESLIQTTKALKIRTFELSSIRVKIDEMKAKIGNTVTNITLPTDVVMSKGLFGI